MMTYGFCLRRVFLSGLVLVSASLGSADGFSAVVELAPAPRAIVTRSPNDNRESRERKTAFEQAIKGGDENLERGDIRSALEHYTGALKGARLLSSGPMEALVRERIGDLWVASGQTTKAIYAYNEGLRLYLENKDSRAAIRTYLKLGFASYLQNDFPNSLKRYQETLSLARATRNLPAQLDALQSLGNLHRSLGHMESARDHLEAALPLAAQQSWRQASLRVNLAAVYNALSDTDQALSFAEQGLADGQTLQRPSVRWHAHLEMGNARLAQGDTNAALQHYRTAVDILESPAARVEPIGPVIEFITPKSQPYDAIIKALGALYQQKPTPEARREAFIYAERARLMAVVNTLESYSIRVPYRSGDIDWATREVRLRAELTRAINDVRTDASGQPTRPDRPQRVQAQSSDYAKFIEEVRAHDPFYASLKYPRAYTPEETAKRVLNKSDTAILAYFLSDPVSYVWVLTKQRFQWHTLPGRQEIETAVHDFRQELMSNSDAPSFGEIGQKLYQALIEPARDDLTGVTHLIVVPHGELFSLPFESIVRPRTTTEPPSRWKSWINELRGRGESPGLHFLIEDFTVVASASVSALGSALEARGRRTRDMENLLALANPSPRRPSAPTGSSGDPSLVLGSTLSAPAVEAPYGIEEIQTLARLFPRKSTRLLIGEDAKESELKKAVASFYRILHFAVPGIIDARLPTLASLTLAPDSPEKEDGNLELSEIFSLNLNADLVTLSACEVASGEGGLLSGSDPLAGVAPLAVTTRAFIQAGASTVCISLWPVSQRSTVELLHEFYANLLSGMAKQDALRVAKLQMLKSGDAPHAYHWAGLVLYGDAESVLFLPQPVSKFEIAGVVLGLLFVTYLVIRLYYGKRSAEKTD